MIEKDISYVIISFPGLFRILISFNIVQRVKEDLYKLEDLKPGSPEFDKLITKIVASLHQHNDGEEIRDLPLLEPAIGENVSRKSAESFKTTRKFVPTRLVHSISQHFSN